MIFKIIYLYPADMSGQAGFLDVTKTGNQLYLADGTPCYPPNGCEYEIVDTINLREQRVNETTQEGLRRIQGYMPGLVSLYVLEPLRELWLSIAPAARAGDFTMGDVQNAIWLLIDDSLSVDQGPYDSNRVQEIIAARCLMEKATRLSVAIAILWCLCLWLPGAI